MKSCRFLSGFIKLEGHRVRILEITCESGYTDNIYVTDEQAFTIKGVLNTWHYEINSENKITLTGVGNNSVDFTKVNPQSKCHETITNWDLLPDDSIDGLSEQH